LWADASQRIGASETSVFALCAAHHEALDIRRLLDLLGEVFVTVSEELREILLDLWKAQGSPISGYILAGPRKSQPVILDNLSKRSIGPALSLRGEGLSWHGWYSLRRFVGTEVRMKADSETSAKALGNSKAVADKHYIKPQTVLPDVRKAVNDAVSGLIR
jgi:hypothetical protein